MSMMVGGGPLDTLGPAGAEGWAYPTPGARVALSKTVVPTLDSTRYGYLMKLVHAAGSLFW